MSRLGCVGTDRLDLHQLLPACDHHLGHFLQPTLQLAQGLFGITIRSVLDVAGFLATALNQ